MSARAKCVVVITGIVVATAAMADPPGQSRQSTAALAPLYVLDGANFPIGPFAYFGEQAGLFFQTEYGTFWIELVPRATAFSGFGISSESTHYSDVGCQEGDEILLSPERDVNHREEFQDYVAGPSTMGSPLLEPQFLLVGLASTYGYKTAHSSYNYSDGLCYDYAHSVLGADVIARVPFNPHTDLVYPVRIAY